MAKMTLDQVLANKMTLAEVDRAWVRGDIDGATVNQYLDLWNATPGRFTRAYISITGTIGQTMSGSKMTPGPWRMRSAEMTGGAPQVVDHRGHRVCTIHLCSDHNADDNARAIAALPDLIEAARRVLLIDRPSLANYERQEFAYLRRILARIEGGE